jgi:CheY-like chemotaxis protein
MELINQYFIETLSMIVVITSVIIYAIVRKPNIPQTKQNKEESKKVEVEEELIVDSYAPENKKIQEEKIEEVIPTIKRTKRELQAHEKITKDDFTTFKGTKILIAEDNFINQKVIMGLLADSGIEITMTNDGQECIDALKVDTGFALILMDAHMPVMDGFQATRHIRKTPEYEHIPVIALSGDTAADDIRNMMNVGMEDHLEKPLRMDALYDILYIYTTGDEANQTSKEIKEEEIEFDINQGLEICGGDKEFYLEILNEFMDNYSRSADKVQEYLNNNNSKEADKLLLDITGLSANIGADYLRRAALDLKQSIASPDDMAYITALKTFKRTLKHITELIQEYIKESL